MDPFLLFLSFFFGIPKNEWHGMTGSVCFDDTYWSQGVLPSMLRYGEVSETDPWQSVFLWFVFSSPEVFKNTTRVSTSTGWCGHIQVEIFLGPLGYRHLWLSTVLILVILHHVILCSMSDKSIVRVVIQSWLQSTWTSRLKIDSYRLSHSVGAPFPIGPQDRHLLIFSLPWRFRK